VEQGTAGSLGNEESDVDDQGGEEGKAKGDGEAELRLDGNAEACSIGELATRAGASPRGGSGHGRRV
jgi:hypothetical protein